MTPKEFLAMQKGRIDAYLDDYLIPEEVEPESIHRAIRYSVFSGGKRFRAGLCIATSDLFGGDPAKVLPVAAGIELIHTYSLVHDDLPALDNDDTRRGQPTCHKRFGEATAVLTGDGLLTLAFQVLSEIRSGQKVRELLREISTAAGSCGMIAGQVADLQAAEINLDLPMLDYF